MSFSGFLALPEYSSVSSVLDILRFCLSLKITQISNPADIDSNTARIDWVSAIELREVHHP